MTTATKALPNNWLLTRFGDVVRYVKIDVDPETSGLERYIAGEHMGTDDLHIRSWGLIGDGYLGPAFHRKFVKGQVLYGSRRTYLRKVAVADFDGICANTTFVLEPSDDRLLPELLPFIMQTDAFNEHSVKQSKGSVNPYINFRDIAWYEFALPPLDEQRRIAEILWAADEACSTKISLVENLSVLRKVAIDQEFPDPASVTDSHQVVLLRDVCDMQNGRGFPSQDYASEGIRLLRPGNLGRDGYFDWTPDITRCLPNQYLESARNFLVNSGDVVINLTAQSLEDGFIGRVCLARQGDESLLNQRIGRFVCSDQVLPEYLYRSLQTSRFRKQVETNCEGSKIKHLYWRHLEDFSFLLPPSLGEQAQIIRRLATVEQTVVNATQSLDDSYRLFRTLRENLLSAAG